MQSNILANLALRSIKNNTHINEMRVSMHVVGNYSYKTMFTNVRNLGTCFFYMIYNTDHLKRVFIYWFIKKYVNIMSIAMTLDLH